MSTEMKIFKKNSKSFSLAALFFPKELRLDAARIYQWCRYCDDVMDVYNGNEEKLKEMQEQTHRIWEGGSFSSAEDPFRALAEVVNRHRIPEIYPLELLKGMEMDLHLRMYKTVPELELYCYRVASTVGLMMVHVMGLYDQKALEQAAQMGMAMQMTNIARDVREDFGNGRLYLPLSWLNEEGIPHTDLINPKYEHRLFKVVSRLLKTADDYYENAEKALVFLPWRSALAVLTAARLYREIGHQVLRKGPSALRQRQVVPVIKKMRIVGQSLFSMLKTIPLRWKRNVKKIDINQIWKPV